MWGQIINATTHHYGTACHLLVWLRFSQYFCNFEMLMTWFGVKSQGRVIQLLIVWFDL